MYWTVRNNKTKHVEYILLIQLKIEYYVVIRTVLDCAGSTVDSTRESLREIQIPGGDFVQLAEDTKKKLRRLEKNDDKADETMFLESSLITITSLM